MSVNTLAELHAKLDAWPNSHPEATQAELIAARVLKENVADLMRLNNNANRRSTLSAAQYAETIFGLS